jgi:hypothetical protein
VRQLLAQPFLLDGGAQDKLMAQVHRETSDLVQFQHITRLLNEQFDQSLKQRAIQIG